MNTLFDRDGNEFDISAKRNAVESKHSKAGDSMTVSHDVKCWKCDGSGFISYYSYIASGQCFACNGRGTKRTKTRVFTEAKLAKLNVTAEKREAKAIAKANAESDKLEAMRAGYWAQFKRLNAELLQKYSELETSSSFISDIMFKAFRFGELTQRQAEAVETAIDRALVEQAQRETAVDVIEGRIEITGVIVSTKALDGYYGTQFKMLVLDDRGFKVWGTIPSSIDCSLEDMRQERITFTATVECSSDDSKFGFFKRPAKAQLAA